MKDGMILILAFRDSLKSKILREATIAR